MNKVIGSKLLALLVVLFIIGRGSSRTRIYDIGSSKCKFEVDCKNDSSCSTFIFIECYLYYCDKYADERNTRSYCLQ